MKKRNKKHNPVKDVQFAANYLAKKYFFICTGGIDPLIFHKSGLKPKSVSNALLSSLLDYRHDWVVWAGIIIRDHQGREETIETVLSCNHANQAEISASVKAEHAKFIDGNHYNPKHFVNAYWAAAPSRAVLHDELVFNTLRKIGAFDTLAQWEAEKHGDGVQVVMA